jgi:hypothetical protein
MTESDCGETNQLPHPCVLPQYTSGPRVTIFSTLNCDQGASFPIPVIMKERGGLKESAAPK